MTERIVAIEAQYAPPPVEPVAAGTFSAELRAALIVLAHRIAAEGGAPHHLRRMVWTVTDPAALVRERIAIDLVYRDVFGGARPPLAIRPAAQLAVPRCRVAVSAELAIPIASGRPRPVYRDLDLAALGREYSARAAVPNHLEIFARWRYEGEAFRARPGAQLDLPYGLAESQRFDLFPPADGNAAPPLALFIHGGYWQAMDKGDHCQFVADLLEAGAAAAVINYGLAPELGLAEIVGQVRHGLAHLVAGAAHYRFDPRRIYVIGHSAGAHLAAMLLTRGWDDALAGSLAGAVLVSGLFDLEPLSLLPMGRLLRIDDHGEVQRLSPALLETAGRPSVIIAVGGGETAEFRRQSALLAEHWTGRAAVQAMTIERTHHFAVIETLHGGALGTATKALIRGG